MSKEIIASTVRDSKRQSGQNQERSQQNFYDVIIIGAGISGLLAADILLRQEKRVMIVQAGQYCGGLIYSQKLKDLIQRVPGQHSWITDSEQIGQTFVQLGASQISTHHTNMIKLIDQLDLTIYSSYSDGKFIYGKTKSNIIHTQSLMDVYLTKEYKKTVLKLISKIQNISRNIKQAHQNSINNPSRNFYKKVLMEYYQAYDNVSVDQFLNKQIADQELRKIVKNQFQTVQSIPTDKISVLQVFLHQYGLQNLKVFVRQDQHNFNSLRIKQGVTQIVKKMLNKIQKKAKKLGQSQEQLIRLNEPVLQIINQINKQVQVKTSKDSYRCFKVLFTASMAKANKIKISKLSQAKRIIFDSQLGGKVQKIFLVFQTAFWRSRYSGKGVFSDQFPFNQIEDCSPPNLSCGLLRLTLCAQRVQKWRSKFQKFQNSDEKQQQMQKFMKSFVSILFLDGKQEHPHLQKMVLIYNQSNLQQNFGYQTFTKSGACLKLEMEEEDYLQSYSRDQHDIIFLGSQLSKKYGSFMQGAVRQVRDKVYKYLQVDDPWNLEN